jgi:phage terminase large subunit-like protein
LILDEAMILSEQAQKAMRPALISRPEAQIWYTSSAGEADSTVLWRMVKRGREGAKRMAYWEWGCPLGADPGDRENWFAANPALGIRLAVEDFEDEYENGLPEAFAQEHLGIWDDQSAGVFPAGAWDGLRGSNATVVGPAVYGLAVSEGRKWACVASAGVNDEGQTFLEYGKYSESTAWVVDWLADLATRRQVRVVIRSSSEAGALIDDLEARKIEVVRASMQDYAHFCGNLYDSVTDRRDIRHPGQRALDVAVEAAQKRRVSDAFVWEQRNPHTDISPLEAVTLAFGVSRRKTRPGRLLIL